MKTDAEAQLAESASVADIQRHLQKLWRQMLAEHGLPHDPADVPIDWDLLESGVDSLMITVFMNSICEELGIELEVSLFFDKASIGALADHIWKMDR